jgi:hypothetical protein
MEIKRKSFHFTGGLRPVAKEVMVGRFRPRWEKQTTYEEVTFEEFFQQVQDFVNGIGRDRIQNICEFTQSLMRYGDDATTTIVVWYWDDSTDPKPEVISWSQLEPEPTPHSNAIA